MYNFRGVKFLMSAPDKSFLPEDTGCEIAFVGRSNAGKSSALNALTEQKQLARTSKTPGRTQMINLFELAPGKRLVDLPGYGYAKVPVAMKRQWQKAMNDYLATRCSLKGLVVVMDIRNPLKELDRQIVDWAISCQLPVLLLLTKADKLNQSPRMKAVKDVEFALQEFEDHELYVKVMPFSSVNLSIGLKNFRLLLQEWFERNEDAASEAETAGGSETSDGSTEA
ncbi:MAG: YihA family ribosome biogenesis GTP-binding protein [Succinivibrionaceae bacterium]|nr:YihA family ribosome biogenesis GTP-binding protein [Succinivibrionaceae bacterium]